jgi:DNA-binding MarR family transcriptional regulator
MELSINDQLLRHMFRFKKVGPAFSSELDFNVTELAIMRRISKNASVTESNECIADIQNRLYITKAAVSQTLNSLEKKGYISREIHKTDRRRVILALTPIGQDYLDTKSEHMYSMLSEIISRFGVENTKSLIKLLDQFADTVDEIKVENSKKDKTND